MKEPIPGTPVRFKSFLVYSLPMTSFQASEFQAMCEWRASIGCSELLCPLQTPVPGVWVVILERMFIWQLQRHRGKERYEIRLTMLACLLQNDCQSNNPSLYVVMMLLPSTSTQVCIIDASVRIHKYVFVAVFNLCCIWLSCIASTLTLSSCPLTAPQHGWLLRQHYRNLPWWLKLDVVLDFVCLFLV